MCNRCHTGWNGNGPDPRDCHGVNCPLGIAHPPASRNARESNFSLGCGICRSEKASALRGTAIQQVVTADNLPKAYDRQAAAQPQGMQGVEYPNPLNEPDLPEYFNWTPEELEEEYRR